jgi:hypothetical protein
MNLSTALNEKFYNFKDKGTNRVAFAADITLILNNHLPEKVTYDCVKRALSYSDKNTKSFLRFLVSKIWSEDPKKSVRLSFFINNKFPNFLDDISN